MWRSRYVGVFVCIVLVLVSSTAQAQKWGRGKPPSDGACFYKDAAFGGDYFCVPAGQAVGELLKDVNDRISSIQTFGRVGLTLYTQPQFKGPSMIFAANVPSLKNVGYVYSVASLRVQIRPSQQEAERIVRRAFKEILYREPGPEGLKFYVPHLVDKGWSEAQVREELFKSDEYKRLSGQKR